MEHTVTELLNDVNLPVAMLLVGIHPDPHLNPDLNPNPDLDLNPDLDRLRPSP